LHDLTASRRVTSTLSRPGLRQHMENALLGRLTRHAAPLAATPRPASPPRAVDDEWEQVEVGARRVEEAAQTDTSRVAFATNEATLVELAELDSRASVSRRLSDELFRATLERHIWALRRDGRAHNRRRRSRSPPPRPPQASILPRGAPPNRTRPPPRPPSVVRRQQSPGGADAATLHPNPTLSNLSVLSEASFQLLLSMQRMLQQDLHTALHHESGSDDEAPVAMEDAIATATGVSQEMHLARQANGNSRLGSCIICCEADVSTVFYRCGHMCACVHCAHRLRQRRAQCPICRASIRDVVQVFMACSPQSAE
jgi:hypothetical protein